jgi:transposase
MKQKANTIGIDLAKQTFHLVGVDSKGKIVWRKKLSRKALMPFMAQLPPALIGMEACGGAHYWARQFRQQGHDVKLMAPQFVKPYVKSNKNDMRDAEAIAEAVTRLSFSKLSGITLDTLCGIAMPFDTCTVRPLIQSFQKLSNR